MAALALLSSSFYGLIEKHELRTQCIALESHLQQTKRDKRSRSKYVSLNLKGIVSSRPRFSKGSLNFQVNAVIDEEVAALVQTRGSANPWEHGAWLKQGDAINAEVSMRSGGALDSFNRFGNCGFAYVKQTNYPTQTKSARTRWSKLLTRYYEAFGRRPGLDTALAMFFGERDVLDDEVTESFASLGMSHALVVSGFHVGVVYGLLSLAVVTLMRISPQLMLFSSVQSLSALLGMLGVTLYVALVGWMPTAVRAAAAAYYLSTAQIFARRTWSSRTIAVALIVVCMFWPGAPLSLGVQLTFSALLGILAALKIAARLHFNGVVLRWLTSNLLCCCGAWLFTAPVLLYWFSKISVWGAPANALFLTPLCIPVIAVCGPLLLIFALLELTAAPVFLSSIVCVIGGCAFFCVECVLNLMKRFAVFAGPQLELSPQSAKCTAGLILCICMLILTLVTRAEARGPREFELPVQPAGTED
ncbi:MAG: ComEC/Rec2 family competence protein [Bdellovibrionales bacterium]|nr:ComEC/Rec2 family competence protein [Bdellovibrionales bacterium]